MGRGSKLQFLPPVGGTAINGYTLYQVIDFLRDWSGRFNHRGRGGADSAGHSAAMTLAAVSTVRGETLAMAARSYQR